MVDSFRITVNPSAEHLIDEALGEYFTTHLGPEIQGNARRTVPVRSGDLKRSIIIQVQDRGADSVLQVGVDEDLANVDYGRYVEEGTSKAPAQPYLRPAVYQARGA